MASNNNNERSFSRGREPLISSGRGGAGNIRPASGSRDPVARNQGPDDFSPVRGRELADRQDDVTTTTGRGGAGNLRSRSREARASIESAIRLERQYTKEKESRQGDQIYSTGRGGAGNMSRSRSRSRDPSLQTPPNALAPTGRGNLTTEGRPSVELSKLDEEDRKHIEHHEAVSHAAGRSGHGNQAPAPAREHHHIQHDAQPYIASGRGGAGNIHATAAY